MAKDKIKGAKGPPNKHLAARTAFLHQAAVMLASQAAPSRKGEFSDTEEQDITGTNAAATLPPHPTSGLPFLFTAQLKQVALKSQVRLHTDVKRTICKACNAILIENQSCRKFVENLSRGGKKDWVDVLVIECLACGRKNRIPTGAKRQQRKSKRVVDLAKSAAPGDSIPDQPSERP
jgi:ribonuclease P protein subunit RPR2